MALTRKQRKREWFFCDVCGRLAFSDSKELEWWIIGPSYGTDVIRCPQHISEWSLRISGRRRTKESFRWMRLAKMNDKYDPELELIEPVLFEE
jgi:hypothetical protein